MSDWKRYGDEKPKVRRPVWVKTRRSNRGRAAMRELDYRSDGYWYWLEGGWNDCRPSDLWCYAEPPPLPKGV